MHRMACLTVAFSALALLLACEDDDDSGAGGGASTSSGGGGEVGGAGGQAAGGSASGGSGGSGGGGGDGGSGGTVGSDGCGLPLGEATEQWVAKTVDVDGTDRDYFVYLPAGYDPARPYPVVYQFHGCSGGQNKQNNNPPVQSYSGAEAIHIRAAAVANCWDTDPDGSGVALFDALVPVVEASWCADPDRRFASGYSSGSFMAHRLGCIRGDMLRAVATIAGGLAGNNCVGQVAALLIHDDTDGTVSISASEQARDRHLANNSCDTQAATTPGDHPPCEVYAGCDAGYPVVWCQTTGEDHSRQDSLSAPAFWDLFAAL